MIRPIRLENLEGSDFDFEQVLTYARRKDSFSFFEFLYNRTGERRTLDGVLEEYADENAVEIYEYFNDM